MRVSPTRCSQARTSAVERTGRARAIADVGAPRGPRARARPAGPRGPPVRERSGGAPARRGAHQDRGRTARRASAGCPASRPKKSGAQHQDHPGPGADRVEEAVAELGRDTRRHPPAGPPRPGRRPAPPVPRRALPRGPRAGRCPGRRQRRPGLRPGQRAGRERRHQPGPDQGRLAGAGGPDHDEEALVDEAADELVHQPFPPDEQVGVRRVVARQPLVRARPPGRAVGEQPGVLGQHLLLELAEPRAGIHAEPVGELGPRPPAGLQRVPLPALPVQGEHEQLPQPLPVGVVPQPRLGLRRRRAASPASR